MTTRKRLTPEQLYAQAEERELVGMTEDGRMVLWDTGRVVPVNRFQYRRDKLGKRWIVGGNYILTGLVLEVVAHLGNQIDGHVSVQLMCRSGRGFAFSTPTNHAAASLQGDSRSRAPTGSPWPS